MNSTVTIDVLRRTRVAVAGLAVYLAVCAAPGVASAQRITVDGRLSPAQTLVGPNYSIGANLGKQVGGNLFHSFGLFSLTKPETASFSGPAEWPTARGRSFHKGLSGNPAGYTSGPRR